MAVDPSNRYEDPYQVPVGASATKGHAMLPKCVSPRFVLFAAIVVSIPPFITILIVIPSSLVTALVKLLNIDDGLIVGMIWGAVYLLSYFLVRAALRYLGISVRSRSVEQFQETNRDDGEVAIELPLQIRHSRRLIWGLSASIFLVGFVLFMMPIWFPHSVRDAVPAIAGTVLMMIGLIVTRWKPAVICEITAKGIRAPAGLWDRQTVVPWDDLVRYEIIRNDGWNCDHFQLWDRSGRCRFNASSWIGNASCADRARIFRALRSRFPGKGKVDSKSGAALLPAASSAVWDRELDG
jgi:hypothetical protein